jgi:hypothetical protein
MADRARRGATGYVRGGDRLSRAWDRYGMVLGWTGIAYLLVAAAGHLITSMPHLLHDIEPWSALDFKYRYGEVAQWFAGSPVYGVVDGAVYPPASHVILWPFMGWLSPEHARLLWGITIVAAATALAWMTWRACGAAGIRARLLIAGLALAAYPLQQSVFVGQLGVHVAAFAVGGAFLAFAERPRLPGDVLAAVLLSTSLVKPTSSLPLVVAALIAAGRARPAVLTGAVYAVLTFAAAAAQPAGLLPLIGDWLAIAGQRVPFPDGVPNLHVLLLAVGSRSWLAPGSLLVLVVMAAWMWRRRTVDRWVTMGIAGIVARFWAHGATYDDAFLLLPAIALLRSVLRSTGRRTRATGALLLAACWAALLTPTWAFYDLGVGVLRAIHSTHAILWLVVLGYLVMVARASAQVNQARPAGAEPSPATEAAFR